MSDDEQSQRPPSRVGSGQMARGPQLRISVSQPLKDHVEEVSRTLGYPSAAEFAREAILLRLAIYHLRETKDVAQAEEILRRLMR